MDKVCNQRVRGFYVYVYKDKVSVGKNGTSIGKDFTRICVSNKELKLDIMDFISDNS